MPSLLTLRITRITDQGSVLVNPESIHQLNLGETSTVNLFVSPKTLQVEVVGDANVGNKDIWIPSGYNIGKINGIARLTKLVEHKTNNDPGYDKLDANTDWFVSTTPTVQFTVKVILSGHCTS